jgi:hypothetical protein
MSQRTPTAVERSTTALCLMTEYPVRSIEVIGAGGLANPIDVALEAIALESSNSKESNSPWSSRPGLTPHLGAGPNMRKR